ncbi:DNA-binding protein [Nocardia terpenica]|nr:DNA-binding protein [Nocardia terpenica]
MVTPHQLAVRWGVTEQYLADMRYHGTGPAFIKVGRKVRYSWRAIREYETANTAARTA